MTILLPLLCWSLALSAHGLLQEKKRQSNVVTPRTYRALNMMRLLLPFGALTYCARIGSSYALLSWLFTFSFGGGLAAIAILIFARSDHHQTKRAQR